MTRTLFLFAILAVFACAAPAGAQESADSEAGRRSSAAYQTSGLPVPRFVSLRSGEVFARSGPALRYPIKWVYQKAKLPVEVVQEFDTWRKVRDPEGDEGWIHQSLLTGQRTALVRADDLVPLMRDGGRSDRLVARLEPDVIVEVSRCDKGYCQVSAGGFTGWAERKYLWGIYEGEELE